MIGFVVAALLAPAPATAAEDIDARQAPRIASALAAIQAHDPQKAIAAIDPAIAAFEARYAGEKRRMYYGMTGTQTLTYMATAATDKVSAVAVGPDYCTALYVKGYALVDLGRVAEARAYYRRAVALAPMHAHFLAELGQSYRPERNWGMMLQTCRAADEVTWLADKDEVDAEKALAWRCMAFALSEQGKLDEAAALYRKCLAIDPKDALSASELQWIAGQRGNK